MYVQENSCAWQNLTRSGWTFKFLPRKILQKTTRQQQQRQHPIFSVMVPQNYRPFGGLKNAYRCLFLLLTDRYIVGQNIAFRVVHVPANLPSSCLPDSANFIFPKLLRSATLECVIKSESGFHYSGGNTSFCHFPQWLWPFVTDWLYHIKYPVSLYPYRRAVALIWPSRLTGR